MAVSGSTQYGPRQPRPESEIPYSGILDALDLFSGSSAGGEALAPSAGGAEAGAGMGSYFLPALATLFAVQQGYSGYKQGKNKPLGPALAQQAKNPLSMLMPSRYVGAGIASTRSGKGEEQVYRDSLRKILQDKGVIDKDWSIGLAGGGRFDIGKDADSKVNGLHPFDVDFSKSTAGQDVGYLQPLAAILSQGNQKGASDFTGYFVNAARSGGDPIKNMVGFYNQAGLNATGALQRINNLEAMGLIDKGRADAYRGGIAQLKGAFAGLDKAPPPMAASPTPPNIVPWANSKFRSTTVSPGILKNGQRINYAR